MCGLCTPCDSRVRVKRGMNIKVQHSAKHYVNAVFMVCKFAIISSPIGLNRDTNNTASTNLFRTKTVIFLTVYVSDDKPQFQVKGLAITMGIFQLFLVAENLDVSHFYCKPVSPMEKLIKNYHNVCICKHHKKMIE